MTSLSKAEAVILFVQRARAARREFELTEFNAETIAQICSRLEGLPLAVELAAARIRLFTPEALLDRLSNRFRQDGRQLSVEEAVAMALSEEI
ncbi:MAG: hypothetical protein R3300_03225 [Candidatus Promineifilaceae bacterium]|nr:hypothetical protein [Candidatus Promineifilaceae bacterium]